MCVFACHETGIEIMSKLKEIFKKRETQIRKQKKNYHEKERNQSERTGSTGNKYNKV